MTAVDIIHALDGLEDSMITELISTMYHAKSTNYVNRKPGLRLIVAATVAVSIIAALGLAAYAISSIHQRRQEELRAHYKVEEHNVTSYVEYDEVEAVQGVGLVSAINDGQFQRVYVNVSPIGYEEAYDGVLKRDFWCSFNGGQTGHNVEIPWDANKIKPEDYYTVFDEDTGARFSSILPEKWAQYMMETSYDEQTQTLTLCCNILNEDIAGRDELELTLLRSIIKDINNKVEVEPGVYGYEAEQKIYGTVLFKPTTAECRRIELESPVKFTDESTGDLGYISVIELYPTAMNVLVKLADSEGEKQIQQQSMANAMEKAVQTVKLSFADGTERYFPGTMAAPVENGYIACKGVWNDSVDINAVTEVEVLGEKVVFNYVN